MPERLRKLIGSIVLVVFVIFYAMTVMTIAAAKLPGTSGLTQLLYFTFTGLLWIIPAGALIAWMVRPRAKKA